MQRHRLRVQRLSRVDEPSLHAIPNHLAGCLAKYFAGGHTICKPNAVSGRAAYNFTNL